MSFLETYISPNIHFKPPFSLKSTFFNKCQEKINEYVIFFYNNSKMLKEYKQNHFKVEKSGGKLYVQTVKQVFKSWGNPQIASLRIRQL